MEFLDHAMAELYNSCYPLFGIDILVTLNNIIPSAISQVGQLLENVSDFANISKLIEMLIDQLSISFDDFLVELLNRPFYSPLIQTIEAFSPLFEELQYHLTNYALEAAQLMLNTLADISGVLSG